MYQRASDKLWCETITIDGKKKTITAKTKAALQKKLRDHNVAQERGPLFSVIADQWEDAHSNKIEGTTAHSYAPHVRRIKEFFEGEYLRDITVSMCEAYVNSLVDRGFARDTVHRGINILDQIFTFAISVPGSGLRYNPASTLKTPRGLKHTKREPPTDEQLIKINANTEMGLFACFLLYTGLRRGEMLGLMWEDIDLDNKEISVCQRVQYFSNQPTVSEGAKTEAGMRKVPLLDELAAVLPKQPRKGYVFGGETPLTHTQFQKRWLAWCREVGLAEAEVTEHRGKNGHVYKTTRWKPLLTPHQLRHNYATMLYYAGADELETKRAMGHSSVAVTHEIYVHIKERDHISKTGEKLNKYLAGEGKE